MKLPLSAWNMLCLRPFNKFLSTISCYSCSSFVCCHGKKCSWILMKFKWETWKRLLNLHLSLHSKKEQKLSLLPLNWFAFSALSWKYEIWIKRSTHKTLKNMFSRHKTELSTFSLFLFKSQGMWIHVRLSKEFLPFFSIKGKFVKIKMKL